MSSNAPYESMEEETTCQKGCRKLKKCLCCSCCFLVVAACLVQALLYYWATMKCNARHLEGYEYPGGGKFDLVPDNSLLVEQEPRWFGSSFINIPADKAGLSTGASTGVYFKTGGPIFNTYTYQDVLSQETYVIRDRPIALGGSHKIMRCDGTGPVYVVSEGGHWLMNNIRELFGMYATRSYNIWQDNTVVAVSEKVGGRGSHKQIIFRAPDSEMPFASCFLKSRNYHGQFEEWFVQEEKNMTDLPAFVPHGACVIMAFVTAKEKPAPAPEGLLAEPRGPAEAAAAPPAPRAGSLEAFEAEAAAQGWACRHRDCDGGGCDQRRCARPRCDGGDCDQAGAFEPTCAGGRCDQSRSARPRCDGGGCVQQKAAAGGAKGACAGGGCGRAEREAKAEEAKKEEAKKEEAKKEDAKAEDAKAHGPKAGDAKSEDAKAEGGKKEEAKAEDGKAHGPKAGDAKPQDAKAEDATPQEAEAQGPEAEDAEAEDAEAEGAAADEASAARAPEIHS